MTVLIFSPDDLISYMLLFWDQSLDTEFYFCSNNQSSACVCFIFHKMDVAPLNETSLGVSH